MGDDLLETQDLFTITEIGKSAVMCQCNKCKVKIMVKRDAFRFIYSVYGPFVLTDNFEIRCRKCGNTTKKANPETDKRPI